jgi:hypothetical protein
MRPNRAIHQGCSTSGDVQHLFHTAPSTPSLSPALSAHCRRRFRNTHQLHHTMAASARDIPGVWSPTRAMVFNHIYVVPASTIGCAPASKMAPVACFQSSTVHAAACCMHSHHRQPQVLAWMVLVWGPAEPAASGHPCDCQRLVPCRYHQFMAAITMEQQVTSAGASACCCLAQSWTPHGAHRSRPCIRSMQDVGVCYGEVGAHFDRPTQYTNDTFTETSVSFQEAADR